MCSLQRVFGADAIWFWAAMIASFTVILWIGGAIYRAHKKDAADQQKDYWVASRDTPPFSWV